MRLSYYAHSVYGCVSVQPQGIDTCVAGLASEGGPDKFRMAAKESEPYSFRLDLCARQTAKAGTLQGG